MSETLKGDELWLSLLDRAGSLEAAKERFLRAVVRAAVRRAGSSQKAAQELGAHRNTVHRYMKPAMRSHANDLEHGRVEA